MIDQRKRCEQSVRREEGLHANTCRPSRGLAPNDESAVLLNLFLYRVIDDALNPLDLNDSAVGPNTHCFKVMSGFHYGFLCVPSTRKHSLRYLDLHLSCQLLHSLILRSRERHRLPSLHVSVFVKHHSHQSQRRAGDAYHCFQNTKKREHGNKSAGQ